MAARKSRRKAAGDVPAAAAVPEVLDAERVKRKAEAQQVPAGDVDKFRDGIAQLKETSGAFGLSPTGPWLKVLLVLITGLAPALIQLLSEDREDTAGEFSGLLLR